MGNNPSYYVGNYKEDAPAHRGWFLGVFMDDVRKTDALEIKYVEGKIANHPPKISETYECTIVIAGILSGEVDGKPITLNAGQYIAIPPGVPNNLSIGSDDLKSFTIKAPSNPGAKKIASSSDLG